MSSINPNLFSANASDWQFKTPEKKAGQPTTIADLAKQLMAGGIDGLQDKPDFKKMVEMFSDPSKATEFTSTTLEGHAEYNLKAAFKLDNGQSLNIDLQVKIDFKFQQATAAYGKNKKQTGQKADNNEFSPENTANRIGNFAMGFLPMFQSNHADQAKNDSVNGFFNLAKDAITKGFDQAKSILGGLYGEDATKTFDLVSKFLDDAKAKILGSDATEVKKDVPAVS